MYLYSMIYIAFAGVRALDNGWSYVGITQSTERITIMKKELIKLNDSTNEEDEGED